ncbi:hypothetical protein ACHAWF_011915 [Thalassiosira exigua]
MAPPSVSSPAAAAGGPIVAPGGESVPAADPSSACPPTPTATAASTPRSTSTAATASSSSSSFASSSDPDLLGLFLRLDPSAPRLDASAWDYLTLGDLHRVRIVSKSAHRALESVEYNRCRDGRDYLVPFPAFPGVLSTDSDMSSGAGLFTHQLASLRAMHRAENKIASFGALRGGVLGDAPGLGKTITMLALIASTSGLRPVEPKEFYDNDSVEEHWRILRTNPVFREEILRAMRPLRGYGPYDQLSLYVEPPYKDDRFPTLASFERYVNQAMSRTAPWSVLDLFRRNVVAFKAGLDKRNRRFFSNEKGKRIRLERNLTPCASTLVLVPDALLEHWAEQIRRHINLAVFADPVHGERCGGVVYVDGVGDLSMARFPLNHSAMPLPSAFDLMSYMVVVMPFSRIKQQYQNARKRQREEDSAVVDLTSEDCTSHLSSSPLLQLRWLRIVVDEGHELGENEVGSNVTKFINDMAAERRWVMSGTPTTGDEDGPHFTAKSLDQLQRLLLFLRHEKYGALPEANEQGESKAKGIGKSNKAQAKSAWYAHVKKPFLQKREEGRKELYRVMDEIMVMHKKEDLGLPKPIFKQSEVAVPVPPEIQSAIIDAVLRPDHRDDAAVLASLGLLNRQSLLNHAFSVGGTKLYQALTKEYTETDTFQSAVDEGQARFIVEGVNRERQELEDRGGAIVDAISAPITAATDPSRCSKSWIDRRPFKAVVYSSSHNTLLSVAEYLYGSFDNEHIAELVTGKIHHMSYELGRFRNNFKQGKNCPICGAWNEFTGKKLTSSLMHYSNDVQLASRIARIAESLISGHFNEHSLRARFTQVEFDNSPDMIVGNPVELDRLEGAPLTKYGMSHKQWRVGDVLCIDARDPHPLLRKRWSQDKWATYGSARCLELAMSDGYEGRDNFLGPLPSYDNDREVMVRLNKWQPCGRFHSRPRWDARRKKNIGWYQGPGFDQVKMIKQDEDTFILLLDASLSHGLDLSFVTHMYLLEPIDDAALLEQVTSRAHRLGCTGPVTVETIHVWQEMNSTTKEVAKQLSSEVEGEAKKRTSTAVCEHCYRSFENMDKAEEHELRCDRNPDGKAIIDPYHLSSVYRDIRPPAPMMVGTHSDTVNT